MSRSASYDAIVIGGGMFGCSLALHLTRHFERVVVLEKETDLLQRASLINQARVHNGYHYPRSLLTAVRSRVNFPRFVRDFQDCVDHSVAKYYAIGRGSRVTPKQFGAFCERVGAPVAAASERVRRLFNPDFVHAVFQVQELAFDAVKLKARLRAELGRARVEHRLGCAAERVAATSLGRLRVETLASGRVATLEGRFVFNCTYSRLNHLLNASKLPMIPLKHELTEMALVEVDEAIAGMGITVMDGPFFSLMPYPSRGLHTLSHVRYTPHHQWVDDPGAYVDAHDHLRRHPPKSRFIAMVKDAERYVPSLRQARFRESLYEVKTVLPSSEASDSRPILFRADHGLPNLICVLGGKIDNVYDVLDEVDARVLEGWLR